MSILGSSSGPSGWHDQAAHGGMTKGSVDIAKPGIFTGAENTARPKSYLDQAFSSANKGEGVSLLGALDGGLLKKVDATLNSAPSQFAMVAGKGNISGNVQPNMNGLDKLGTEVVETQAQIRKTVRESQQTARDIANQKFGPGTDQELWPQAAKSGDVARVITMVAGAAIGNPAIGMATDLTSAAKDVMHGMKNQSVAAKKAAVDAEMVARSPGVHAQSSTAVVFGNAARKDQQPEQKFDFAKMHANGHSTDKLMALNPEDPQLPEFQQLKDLGKMIEATKAGVNFADDHKFDTFNTAELDYAQNTGNQAALQVFERKAIDSGKAEVVEKVFGEDRLSEAVVTAGPQNAIQAIVGGKAKTELTDMTGFDEHTKNFLKVFGREFKPQEMGLDLKNPTFSNG